MMASPNYIRNVAIVGAGGNSGKFMTEALLNTGKHTVTALTRIDSQSKLPDGVIVKKINYDESSTIVDALKGQDALVITISGFAGHDVQATLIAAAHAAGVPWILPNDWSPDTANTALTRDVAPFQEKEKTLESIAKLANTSYVSVTTGFWYEWSLAMAVGYGFDFKTKRLTLFGDGNTKTSTSTWPHVGRAVASLLSLPLKPVDGDDPARCLDNFRNKHVYVSSFCLSQNDMLESVLRVTGDRREDWTVVSEPAAERYRAGLQAVQQGDRMGFARMMYTRVFFDDGVGDFEDKTSNALLSLPKEQLDEATVAAIHRAATVTWP